MRLKGAVLSVIAGCCVQPLRAVVPGSGIAPAALRSPYFWNVTPVGDSARLFTLECHGCGAERMPGDAQSASDSTEKTAGDIPLLAVLKDTLGDGDAENDRLTAVWLLGYNPPNIGQRLLSALPFFYWRPGLRSGRPTSARLKPELDLTALQHPAMNAVSRDALQWLMLDPSTMPVRATTRAYRSNELDHERLALAEAISYLRAAGAAGEMLPHGGLTDAEVATLVIRLELRKTLLGGFVSEHDAARFGEQEAAARERVRSRNWETLRQCADKTGLYFEPFKLAGDSAGYAMLWAPAAGLREESGTRLELIWKLLNIRRPDTAELEKLSTSDTYIRELDEQGNLLPAGAAGAQQIRLAPLSAYDLNYPRMPLLLVDFRGGRHIRWHAMTQRSINEVTAGVIGISHFTNWYYYAAADFYDFVASRHGAALSQTERLDCYSEFRVALALDHGLDGRLRTRMQQQIDSLAMNPLEDSPDRELAAAMERSKALQAAAADGRLAGLLDRDRRAELAAGSASPKRIVFDNALHLASLGIYTHRAPKDGHEMAELNTIRRTQAQLSFLQSVTAQGTQPEVAFEASRIQSSLAELQHLLPHVASRQLRSQAGETIARVQTLSRDQALRTDCNLALASLHTTGQGGSSGNIALKPGAVRNAAAEGQASARR